MGAYLFRRILYAIPTLLGVAFIVFTLFNWVGGDPAVVMLGKHATPARVLMVRQELGLDQPKTVQFVEYLRQVVTFDFGRSYSTHENIRKKILHGLGPTLSLSIPAFLLTSFLSLMMALLVSRF